ncbi:MAG TPA: VapC toxin family PIN domain ribonuclease [Lentisphaeria bacterium]|nr:MAG: hypothetical protein A2X45_08185 [Lentisphaerae bacterium GWF2_50_93]HCE43750.1 VapC toxin family PIN domain ribonuclease [Lentisphaeria bacterium]
MFYADTSIVVAYYCAEEKSSEVEKLIVGSEDIAISMLAEVEFYSALSRKVRERTVTAKDARRISSQFELHLNGDYFTILQLESSHYAIARNWISNFDNSLRPLDALHLAIAFSNNIPIATSDKTLAKSADMLGVGSIPI